MASGLGCFSDDSDFLFSDGGCERQSRKGIVLILGIRYRRVIYKWSVHRADRDVRDGCRGIMV